MLSYQTNKSNFLCLWQIKIDRTFTRKTIFVKPGSPHLHLLILSGNSETIERNGSSNFNNTYFAKNRFPQTKKWCNNKWVPSLQGLRSELAMLFVSPVRTKSTICTFHRSSFFIQRQQIVYAGMEPYLKYEVKKYGKWTIEIMPHLINMCNSIKYKIRNSTTFKRQRISDCAIRINCWSNFTKAPSALAPIQTLVNCINSISHVTKESFAKLLSCDFDPQCTCCVYLLWCEQTLGEISHTVGGHRTGLRSTCKLPC